MKHLLLISLLAMPLTSNAMVGMTPRERNFTHWVDTLGDIVQEFNAGTLTQQRVDRDVVHASWTDAEVQLGRALQEKAAIIRAVRAIIAKGAAATPQELENAKAGLMYLENGLSGRDKLAIRELAASLR